MAKALQQNWNAETVYNWQKLGYADLVNQFF